jgi:hypothetical protein
MKAFTQKVDELLRSFCWTGCGKAMGLWLRRTLVLKNRYRQFSILVSSVMKSILPMIIFVCLVGSAHAQKPKNGTYSYKVTYAEWQEKSLGSTCTVLIKGDSITVMHDGNKYMTGNKGDILDRGVILKHKSGKWIIGHDPKDKDAKEVGGCGDGPTEIDFKRKIFRSC